MGDHNSKDMVRISELSKFLDALQAPFVVYDPDERIVVCNSAYKSEYHPCEDMVKPGVTHTELQWLKVEQNLDRDAIGRAEDFVKHEQDRHRFGPEVEEWKDDSGRFMRLLRARLPDGHVIGMRIDITDLRLAQNELEERNQSLKEVQRKLESVAMVDDLTGLANRRAASIAMEGLAVHSTATGSDLTLVVIDLDGFKQINDSFGHAAGDALLCEVANRMVASFGEDALVARMGGDEFLVVLQEVGEAEALELTQSFIHSATKPVQFESRTLHVGVSAGIATESGDETEVASLLAMADLALYRAKEETRNAARIFDKEMKKQAKRDSRLRQDILSGLLESQLEVYFQPIVTSADPQQVPAAEALVRWRHPEFGLIAPNGFFNVVEQLRMMQRLDEIVLTQVVQQIDTWHDQGMAVPKVSVNISPHRLLDAELLNSIERLKVPCDAICFEILETVFSDTNNSLLQWNLDRIHDLGIELQIDDYGTSHSSISSLMTIRPARIKIDRQFCAAVVDSAEARDIVRLTVALANSLGISVIGEGVETAEVAARLSDLGCDRLQGYFFGKPCPAAEFPALVQNIQSHLVA